MLRIVGSIFLIACGQTVSLWQVRTIIEDATPTLNEQFGHKLVITTGGHIIVTVSVQEPDGPWDGWSRPNEAGIKVQIRISARALRSVEAVVMHEIGHALGLGHSPDGTSVMYYIAQEASLSDMAAQLAELCTWHHCAKTISFVYE